MTTVENVSVPPSSSNPCEDVHDDMSSDHAAHICHQHHVRITSAAHHATLFHAAYTHPPIAHMHICACHTACPSTHLNPIMCKIIFRTDDGGHEDDVETLHEEWTVFSIQLDESRGDVFFGEELYV